jgi:hypothetical protein
MKKAPRSALGLLALSVVAPEPIRRQEQKPDPLQPFLFLEGVWHGEGKGPYGPYEFLTRVERRGRWLLLASDVFAPGTDKVMFVSTQVYGYDEGGLVLQLFDTAGAFSFRGEAMENGARFEWKDRDRYKKIDMRVEEGRIRSRYDALEPALFKDPVTFEGVWIRGERPAKGGRKTP